jgi:hypothetical protein
MAISANTLGDTATSLMGQLNAGTITFENYCTSMSSVIQSATNNEEFKNEDNAVAIHNVNLAIRLTTGEASPTRRR